MTFAHTTSKDLLQDHPPEKAHCLRYLIGRGGNGKQFYWVCQACRQRVIEVERSTGRVVYYHVPPCREGQQGNLAHEPGTVTDVPRRPPSKEKGMDTPPYPWPDRAPFARPTGGRPVYESGGYATGAVPAALPLKSKTPELKSKAKANEKSTQRLTHPTKTKR